jgi:hypothetical protein
MMSGGRYIMLPPALDELGRTGERGTRGTDESECFLPSTGTLSSPLEYAEYGEGDALQDRKGEARLKALGDHD